MAQAPAIRRTELYKQRSALASGSAARCGIRSAAWAIASVGAATGMGRTGMGRTWRARTAATGCGYSPRRP